MAFFQEPPHLENTYLADQTLQSFLRRHIPEDARKEMKNSLSDLGELAAGELRDLALEYANTAPFLGSTNLLSPIWQTVPRTPTTAPLP
jgi:hypothetical protein